eukprot:TRINITY_DN2365_c0_g2_i1.p1 TRINITY_DN2365_c0_g2~~TRINITY_DN2365_c0_g2_i1.p1  ORF type:complete len:571 (+),score=170.35 TRINITY_DN2365_c0_g2_i1:204-1916(+)
MTEMEIDEGATSLTKSDLLDMVQSNDSDRLNRALNVLTDKTSLIDSIRGVSLLNIAIECDALECAAILLQKGICHVDEQDSSGATALHSAASDGNMKAIKFLLEWKAKLSARDERGETPLHFACYFGHDDVVELLCTQGAYIDIQSETLVTPLHAATINRQLKCVALLVAKGADTSLKDSNGKTAMDLVRKDDSELLSCFQSTAYKRLEDIESLQTKRMMIERQLEEEREKRKEKETRIANLYKEMKIMEDEKKTLGVELQASNNEKEQLKNTIKELQKTADVEAQRRDELERSKLALEDTLSRSEFEKQDLLKRIQELEQQVQFHMQNDQNERQRLVELEEELETIKRNDQIQKEQIAKLQTDAQREYQRAEAMTAEATLKGKSHEIAVREIAQLNETKNYIREQLVVAEEKIIALTSQLQQQQQTVQALQNSNQLQQTQIQRLQQQMQQQYQLQLQSQAPVQPQLHPQVQLHHPPIPSQVQPTLTPAPAPAPVATPVAVTAPPRPQAPQTLPQSQLQPMELQHDKSTEKNENLEEELAKAKSLIETLGALVFIANTALTEAQSKLSSM